MNPLESALLIDIGSTFTKGCAINLDDEELLVSVASPSTPETDVCEGIDNVIFLINNAIGEKINFNICLASSSAAGGLRMVVVGLVPDLTSQAARLAALGAGAKVIGTYSYKLTKKEKKEIELYNPDIILLVGGTDGGNEEIILWNANIISHVNNNAPIIIAGNKVVAQNVVKIFNLSGKTTFVSDNVMPTIGKFNVDPVREMIQSIFVDRIIISQRF